MSEIALFAGYVGLPEGFMIAGFDIIVGVDHDAVALRAFKATQINLVRLFL